MLIWFVPNMANITQPGLDSTVSHTGFYNIMSEESSTCSTFTTLRVTFGNLRSLQVKSAAVILIVNIFIFEMASVISLVVSFLHCIETRQNNDDDDDYNDDDESINNFVDCTVIHKGPVVQKADNAIHWKKFDSGDNPIGFAYTYPLDRDLSGG